MYRIRKFHFRGVAVYLDKGDSSENNFYSLLIGNNGSGKTSVLTSIISQIHNIGKNNSISDMVVEGSVNKTIVLTNTIGDTFPNDKSPEDSYDSLNYVYLGSRVASGGYTKKFLLERLCRIFIEKKHTPDANQRLNILSFFGYKPVVILEYKYNLTKSSSNLTKTLTAIEQSELFSKAHKRALCTFFNDLIAEKSNSPSDKVDVSAFINLLDNSIDVHSGYPKDIKNLGHELFLLRRLGLIQLKSARVESNRGTYNFDYASSGEANLFTSLLSLTALLENNSLILIDEPEVSMHPQWQVQYMTLLKSIVETRKGCHIIIATHSHFFVSDLDPKQSAIVTMSRNDEGQYASKQLDYSPYAWSAENILLEVFGVPCVRNYYLANKVQTILNTFADNTKENQITKEDYEFLEKMKNSLQEVDPLKEIIKDILSVCIR